MEITTRDGKVKTASELREEAIERMVDELDRLDTNDALELGNEWRDNCGEPLLHENTEYNLNDILDGYDPYEILCMGSSSWSDYDDFVYIDRWGDMECTDYVWSNIDIEDLATELINGDFEPYAMPSELRDVIDEYNSAVQELENYNPYRAMAKDIIRKYVNCEADVTDLLQTLDKLARTDEAWARE